MNDGGNASQHRRLSTARAKGMALVAAVSS